MAKIQYCGVVGKIITGTHTLANMVNVTLDINNPTTPTPKFEDTAESKKQCGFYSWGGTFDGYWDMITNSGVGQKVLHDAILGGTTVTLKIYINAVAYYSGTAYISTQGNTGSAEAGSIWKASFTYESAGALLLTLV